MRYWIIIAKRLWDWNSRLNLTRHTDYEKFVARDVVDSQWLERFLESGESVLDVGTGGGVPGVVLAILRPDLDVALCDSVAKKARAVAGIIDEMGLKIPVHHAPAQELIQRQRFDTLVMRAVAPLSKIADLASIRTGTVSTGCWCSRGRLGSPNGRMRGNAGC